MGLKLRPPRRAGRPPAGRSSGRDHGHVSLSRLDDPGSCRSCCRRARPGNTSASGPTGWRNRTRVDQEAERAGAKQFVRVFNLLEKEPLLEPLLLSPRLPPTPPSRRGGTGGVRVSGAGSTTVGDYGSLWTARDSPTRTTSSRPPGCRWWSWSASAAANLCARQPPGHELELERRERDGAHERDATSASSWESTPRSTSNRASTSTHGPASSPETVTFHGGWDAARLVQGASSL